MNLDQNQSQKKLDKKAQPKTFNCPSCGGSITIKAVGSSINAVCAYCSSVIDTSNDNYQIILKANQKTRKTLIEIGARGKLFDKEWEVIGYTEKSDGSNYFWDEYLLYNPYYGFRFLVQSDGHWNFIKVIKRNISSFGSENEIYLDDKEYDIFLRGNSVVEYVKGEFYWQVEKGEQVKCADYIAPPYMISVEESAGEINVSFGEYLESKKIAEAFKINSQMRGKIGVGANQPSPLQNKLGKIWMVAACFVVIAFFVQLFTANNADNTGLNIAADSNYKTLSSQENILVTEQFNIPKTGNVMVRSFIPVENDWAELRFSLVNVANNQEYNFIQPIEYYFGRDSQGYAWSEGKQSAKTFISRVKEGNYRLLIDFDSGLSLKSKSVNLSLEVRNDAPQWLNFIAAIALILIFPVLATLLRWRFENRRWANSDYAPEIYSND